LVSILPDVHCVQGHIGIASQINNLQEMHRGEAHDMAAENLDTMMSVC